MSQCEYTKPHPKHHWWVAKTTTPVSNHRQCEGVKDPNPPAGTDYDTHTSHPAFSKQSLGEFELWEREQRGVEAGSHIANAQHLHFIYLRDNWEWVLRWSKSPLCNTPRCRPVTIKEEKPDAPK